MSLFLCVLAHFQADAEEKIVRFCTLVYPPYIYPENGKAAGMAIDIVTEAFASQGYKITVELLAL